MAREKENYRDVLAAQIERIKDIFPDKEMLNQCEVQKFLGWGNKRIKKYVPFSANQISVVKLAKFLID